MRPVIPVSSDTTITSTFSGCDVIASGGQHILTLASATGSTDGCDVRIINADSGSGKVLANFPSDVRTKLYPNQSIEVTTYSSAWIAARKPGRFMITPTCQTVYVSNVSSNASDSNDGLTPSTPLLTNGEAVRVVQKDFDTQQQTPIIALVAGSSFMMIR
jgi:hypothetical protein